jgi:transmembrane sensor
MADNIPPAALARYLSGECDAGETTEVERWIASDPKHLALVDLMRVIWARPAAAEADFDTDDAIWQRIARRMEEEPARPSLVHRRTPDHTMLAAQLPSNHSRWRIGVIAAAAVLMFAAGSTLWREQLSTRSEVQVATAAREIVTHRGQQAVLDLADGSRVRLGPESKLTISGGLGNGSGTRDVSLEGTALFTVTHDSAHPFRVHTSAGVAEDLGTEFVVTDYPETRGMRVMVAAGMVAIHRRNTGASTPPLLILTKGMIARLDTAGTATVMQGVDIQSYLSWTRGALAFNGMRLREVVPELSRWYGVDVTLTDSALGERRVTASFEGESVAHVLRRLALALNLHVERHGHVVKLRPS